MQHDPIARLNTTDWSAVVGDLDAGGRAVLPGLLDERSCSALAGLYEREEGFRSEVIMARHGFGQGRYKYFAHPLPELVSAIREAAWPYLVPIAHGWHQRMGLDVRFPETHRDFIARCHAAGQRRLTPLLLDYGPGDHNCLHQDLYGAHVFPLQIAVLLSAPGHDFTGGEFVMTEQRPRMQSRPDVVPLGQGDAVVFAVNQRPVRGSRGDYRVTMRHGVARVRSGRRRTLGIIFHDAA